MIELLAPAGDLEKLKIALLYGADACFVGGTQFSLRARASNFTLDDIQAATTFAHQMQKKVYVTTNIIPHEEDYEGLIEYLKALDERQVDAIISASPYIIQMALDHTNLEVHLSTQQSAINQKTVEFWRQKGIKRVVLGRELTKTSICEIAMNSKADIEVFIHGGMCMSYSGRCSLSDNMTGRDANRGGCAHSCRWDYQLKQAQHLVHETPFSMSSKDLQAIEQIPYLIDSNVKSLKIEGRMKSLHYIATVVNVYRRLIDEYQATKQIQDFSIYTNEIQKAENRLASYGYLEGLPGVEQQLYHMRSEKPNQLFVGLIKGYDKDSKMALLEQRNYFKPGDTLEIFSPKTALRSFKVEKIFTVDDEVLEVARHPKQLLKIYIPFDVNENDMVRIV